MARSTFYYNIRQKPDKWAIERQRIEELYHQNKGRYGYRRLTLAMRNEGYVINGKTVRRLMAETGIKCQVRMKKYKEALSYMEKALRYLDADNAEIYEHYGDVLYMCGEKEKALENWHRAVQLNSTSETLDRKIREEKYLE